MDDPDKELVVSYLTLRQMIGWIALLMPVTVKIGAAILDGIPAGTSISAYYYTSMRDVFVSTMVLVGVLVACYRTPDLCDNVVAVVAGIAAICIGLVPTDPPGAHISRLGECHLAFAIAFSALSFYLVYFRFGAFTPPAPSRQKRARNRTYKACGLVMLVCFVADYCLLWQNQSVFWPEAISVIAFSIAWLVKGRTVLKERAA